MVNTKLPLVRVRVDGGEVNTGDLVVGDEIRPHLVAGVEPLPLRCGLSVEPFHAHLKHVVGVDRLHEGGHLGDPALPDPMHQPYTLTRTSSE